MNKFPIPLLCLRKSHKMTRIQFEIDATPHGTQNGQSQSHYGFCSVLFDASLQQDRKETNAFQHNYGNLLFLKCQDMLTKEIFFPFLGYFFLYGDMTYTLEHILNCAAR